MKNKTIKAGQFPPLSIVLKWIKDAKSVEDLERMQVFRTTRYYEKEGLDNVRIRVELEHTKELGFTALWSKYHQEEPTMMKGIFEQLGKLPSWDELSEWRFEYWHNSFFFPSIDPILGEFTFFSIVRIARMEEIR